MQHCMPHDQTWKIECEGKDNGSNGQAEDVAREEKKGADEATFRRKISFLPWWEKSSSCTDLERTPNLSGPSVKVLLWGPFRQTGSLVGRSTRALFEWDTPRTRACVLKDTWRFVEGDAMAQKSEVVETLHRRQVPDIPGLISKDDVEGEDALTHFSPDWVAVTKSKGWGQEALTTWIQEIREAFEGRYGRGGKDFDEHEPDYMLAAFQKALDPAAKWGDNSTRLPTVHSDP
ncbi:hypothetical protein CC1G_05986 [Coprinopsis cinerea okayama7|uniref:Uncharacterized protein n=1 Tax=Coprinopsis cinerea (strain Okayama-7 / 130 / ATCC MYA-4618 / FGSC 9003) TaxID=240176 RepID=A8N4K8_COPC7|nr:hypothetical protein CC1G_05986 [Coprinopsis cinerea okayama7\|eukprot:XP_001829777.2 hypothetical protein CC1G_05986 [Coprinopsis cinerea okayama7\